jgi:multiple sugar transport system substrate-binding protein
VAGPYYVFPAAAYEGLLCVYNEVLQGIQPDYFKTHGFDFETPEAAKALQLLVDCVQKNHMTPTEVTGMTEVSSYEYFLRTNGCFIRGWTSYDRDFPDMTSEAAHRKAPATFAGPRPSGWDLMVSKFGSGKAEAVAFVSSFSKRNHRRPSTKAGYFPSIRACKEEACKKYPELTDIVKDPLGVHRPAHPNYTRYSEALAQYFSQAVRGRISVEEALRQSNRAIGSENVVLTRK